MYSRSDVHLIESQKTELHGFLGGLYFFNIKNHEASNENNSS